jgi:hypothetical protein
MQCLYPSVVSGLLFPCLPRWEQLWLALHVHGTGYSSTFTVFADDVYNVFADDIYSLSLPVPQTVPLSVMELDMTHEA